MVDTVSLHFTGDIVVLQLSGDIASSDVIVSFPFTGDIVFISIHR